VSWSAPMTAVAGATFTAAAFNQYVRDNLNETGPAKVTAAGQLLVSTAANALAARAPGAAVVATSQTTTSTSYADLATVGPSVTVTTGTQAVVWHGAAISNSGANSTRMSVAVSGASTVAASDAWAAIVVGTSAHNLGKFHFFTGLTAGSNIFTAKYSVAAGTGTYVNRELVVIPL
jgi:hypothetical protein